MTPQEGIILVYALMVIASIGAFCLGLLVGYLLGKKDRQPPPPP
jgi:Na+/citrate or Na+/malate symporter